MIKIKRTLLLTAFVWAGLSANAQQDDKQEKIKALKVAFFTEQLKLTPEEASVFWPIYNAHEADKEALRNAQRREVFQRVGAGDYTEAEARAILTRNDELEAQEEQLDRQFHRKMAETFSASRTLQLFKAEYDFRRRLLNEFRKRGGGEKP